MYFIKAKTEENRFKKYLSNIDFSDITGMNRLNSSFGNSLLEQNYLHNQKYPTNASRFDNLIITKFLVNYFLRNDMTTPPLHFANEVLKGDLVYQKNIPVNPNGSGTVFRCQKPGLYDVKGHIRLLLRFDRELPNQTNRFASIDLMMYKNGNFYSYLSHDKGNLLHDESASFSIDVHLEDTYFFMNGADYIQLDAGDEIDLRLAADLSAYTSEFILTNLSCYGYFDIGLQSECIKKVNNITQEWYNE